MARKNYLEEMDIKFSLPVIVHLRANGFTHYGNVSFSCKEKLEFTSSKTLARAECATETVVQIIRPILTLQTRAKNLAMTRLRKAWHEH